MPKEGVLARLGVAKTKPDARSKATYKEVNGTSRVGDALRWLSKTGKSVAPELLELAGAVTGYDGLKLLGNKIRGSDSMSDLDKEYALKQLELDMVEAQEVTKRWEADMKSDSWLSKNVRPGILVLLIFTTLVMVILDSSTGGFNVADKWINLLISLDMTALGGYFALREVGKGITKRG